MSLRRARTEPSCINKVPQRKLGTEKRKPRRPCRGFPYRYTFPRLFARISLLTKVVQRGETRATQGAIEGEDFILRILQNRETVDSAIVGEFKRV
jgi:hypothetical protein